MTILIVDDNSNIRSLLKDSFTSVAKVDVEFKEADNADDAIKIAKKNYKSPKKIDLAILDFELGRGITGDFLSVLLKHVDAGIKTILFTASEDKVFLPYFKAYKFDAVVHKDEGIKSLLDAAGAVTHQNA